ncbi:MAG: hypothetical protein ACLFQK_05960 [Fibrobacterota bacterium]
MAALLFISAAGTAALDIRDAGVLPGNPPDINRERLQAAIDRLSDFGGSLYVGPSKTPYHIESGIILRKNVSLRGASSVSPRGTSGPSLKSPVGSVFKITGREKPFITVESATAIEGIQFWYSEQATVNPDSIIQYPPTITMSKDKPVQGVFLNELTFYGEYTAMDFAAPEGRYCELITIKHCAGYPLGGTFIKISRCYDIPRILHCHVNPAVSRLFAGDYSKEIIDKVACRDTYAYIIEKTDNARLIDIFAFGVFGGIYLGPSTYGQLSDFNFDCVTVGIRKKGDGKFNRTWNISQGAIIANRGDCREEIHPVLVSGSGHLSLANVEAFSGHNQALTTIGSSHDFLKILPGSTCTVFLSGCRMQGYVSENPFTVPEGTKARIRASGCLSKDGSFFDYPKHP